MPHQELLAELVDQLRPPLAGQQARNTADARWLKVWKHPHI
jgi:hypothetical protein